MPGINTTGTPNTDDYNLGRGIVYFSPLDSNDLPIAYRDLGNAPEFNISIETETLEHQSSREGLKVTDKEVLISQKVSLSLTLDEINFQNLASLLSGEAVGNFTNPAIAGFSYTPFIEDAELGKWYDIKTAGGVRAYNVKLANLTLAVGATTLVSGTDFILDEEMGRVFLMTSAVNVAAGNNISIVVTQNGSAGGVDEVRALTQTAITGALKFVASNPASNDKRTEYQFHKVSLKAEGDFALIGDEFSTMQFTAVAERNEAAGGVASPTLTVRTLKAS